MILSTKTRSYLICATPRTGSTLLCGLLQSTGVAGQPESYFRAQDEQAWAADWKIPRSPDGQFRYSDYVRAAVKAGQTENGVFGARVMWGTLEEVFAKLRVEDSGFRGTDLDLLNSVLGSTRIIHLWRHDTVAQAVSWVRAEQTNFWQHGDARNGQPPRFDLARIHSVVEMINEHNEAWREWFTSFGIRPHQVSYEELTNDMEGVTHQLVRFLELELPKDWVVAPRHHRQADEINREWITRYRASVVDPH